MKQELKSTQTKELILNNAFRSIYREGYKSVNVMEIMQETGLTKGAFYHHFKNKEELTLQMVEHNLHARIYHHMIKPLYEKGNVIDQLIEVFTTRLQHFTDEEKQLGCPLNNLINELSTRDKELRYALDKIIQEWKTGIVQLLERGIKEGQIKPTVKPTHVATFIISAFEGARGIRKLQDNDEWLENFKEFIQEYLISLKNIHNRM